jgi:hypothetical protein
MRLPGFGAPSSLYKTNGYYQMAGGFEHVDGITPQAITCGECYLSNGTCVRDCTICIWHRCPPGRADGSCDPGGCTTTTLSCPASECG